VTNHNEPTTTTPNPLAKGIGSACSTGWWSCFQ